MLFYLFQATVLHSYSKFEELLGPWESSEYLPKEWLPKEKVLYHQLPDEYINQLMVSIYFFSNIHIS